MKTAQFLFWLGVIVMLVTFLSGVINMIRLASTYALGFNWANYLTITMGAFFQGGVLIGLSKIIEALNNKTKEN